MCSFPSIEHSILMYGATSSFIKGLMTLAQNNMVEEREDNSIGDHIAQCSVEESNDWWRSWSLLEELDARQRSLVLNREARCLTEELSAQ